MLLTAIALLLSLVAPSYALDITNDPNQAFLEGYRHIYKHLSGGSVCQAEYAELPSGRKIIGLNYLCEGLGITDKQVYSDAMSAMHQIKSTTHFKNFAEYFDDQRKKVAAIAERNKVLCVDDSSGTYMFLPAASVTKKGWYYISKLYNGGGLRSGTVGLWKHGPNGSIVADFGPSLVNINMANVYDCRNP